MGSNELGERLRALRRQRGFSRLALSDEADVSATYIAQIEGGVDPRTGKPFQPSPGVLRRLALALARQEPGAGHELYAALMAAAGYLPQEVEDFSAGTIAWDAAEAAPPAAAAEPLPAPLRQFDAREEPLGSVAEGFARRLPPRGRAEADASDLPLRAEVALVLEHWNDLSPGERAALYAVARLIAGRYPWAAIGPETLPDAGDDHPRQGR
jgi:transcriptional regulator with XRE-family HTH domain